MVYVVIGMHKSGTSLISQTLYDSGVNMGTFDSGIDYYNGQKYERDDIHKIIVKMLGAENLHSVDTIPPFNEDVLLENLPKFINIIHECNSNYDLWGFKNPRTIFVYDYIKPYLGNHKLICVYRKLDEVAAHYSQYGIKYIFKAIKAWNIYNKKMIDIIARADVEFILINYEKYMLSSTEFKKLKSFLDLPINDCRNQTKKRNIHYQKIFFSKHISNICLLFNVMDLRTISKKLEIFENSYSLCN